MNPLTVNQVAERLGVAPTEVRRLVTCKHGMLVEHNGRAYRTKVGSKFGKVWMFYPDDIYILERRRIGRRRLPYSLGMPVEMEKAELVALLMKDRNERGDADGSVELEVGTVHEGV